MYHRVVPSEYLKQANDETLIAVQAESPEAINNLESIAAVSGVDVIFVGPFDLSVSLGIPGDMTHPREVEAIDRIMEVCRQQGLVAGIHLFDLQALKTWVGKGMRFVTYSSDVALLADAAASWVAEIKKFGVRGSEGEKTK